MSNLFLSETKNRIVPIVPVCQNDFSSWLNHQGLKDQNLIATHGFLAKSSSYCLLTNQDGLLEKVLLGMANQDDFFSFGELPKILPAGCYEIVATNFSSEQLERAAIGWGMGAYQFRKYKKVTEYSAALVCPKILDIAELNRAISGIFLVRDLINTPASDFYPEKLAEVALSIAAKYKAAIKVTKGAELVQEFPAVYAVGRGSKKEPLLIDLNYGDTNAPKVVLVGKGVCFDAGGLQIKPDSAMVTMKKDMAGAAHVLALAQMIMDAKLPINLRVIIPAVENLVGENPYKPGDVIKSRQGLTIEVAHTDAEGRLILADALTLASEWQPELILDFATLTGAAWIALGNDISALYATHDQLANDLALTLNSEQEQVWRMPLYQPYTESLKSKIADLKNVAPPNSVGAGSIIGALFLQQFVTKDIEWAHFDIGAYNPTAKPAKPEGGEASCLRGIFKYLSKRFKN